MRTAITALARRARAEHSDLFTDTLWEEVASAITHGVGAGLAIAALVLGVVYAAQIESAWAIVAIAIYGATLVFMFLVSTLYHSLPNERAKRLFLAFDHIAIFLLIAGTYTPFLVQLDDTSSVVAMIAIVWGMAAAGIVVKLAFPGRFDRIAIGFYILIGWSGAVYARPLMEALPASTLWFILAGGAVYTAGVVFHAWHSLRFQNAVWHGFVVVAAGLHLAAVMDTLVIDRL